jgi:hypothetical protein
VNWASVWRLISATLLKKDCWNYFAYTKSYLGNASCSSCLVQLAPSSTLCYRTQIATSRTPENGGIRTSAWYAGSLGNYVRGTQKDVSLPEPGLFQVEQNLRGLNGKDCFDLGRSRHQVEYPSRTLTKTEQIASGLKKWLVIYPPVIGESEISCSPWNPSQVHGEEKWKA